jgi:hypothetical protein
VALALYEDTNYNFDANNVKVLEGGWNAWLEKNSTDPTNYPVEP